MKFLIPILFVALSVPATAQRVIAINGVPVQRDVPTNPIEPTPPCAEERAAWEQADQALNASVVKKNSAASEKAAAAEAVTTAQAALDAAQADLTAKSEAYDTAVAAVQAASAAATAAYGAYVECRSGQ